ncbi:hypothetical protein LUZ63_023604 [Rhynchospora breviuscula]|uniref:Elongation factor Ts, mitochondrial n=1 Tax=Rhynchospora breviuscula TaxID=2022672 RepID=A0A9Q0BWP5_9POAL|nr:hypothetical protein LUZ63_023604 [Rhynchospora breviuscula]
MAVVTIRQLLDSGVHFGHQTRRWNPKVKRFILTERSGIHIIDLQQSLSYIDKAYEFVKETVAHGGTILFVGTKKQAQEVLAEQATRVGQPYVNQRWLGGLLTNFSTVSKRLARMKELEELDYENPAESGFTKKELLLKKRELDKLHKSLGGIRNLQKTPPRSGTRSPGNDDAIRSVSLLTRIIADAAAEGLIQRHQPAGEDEAAEPLAEWERELLETNAETTEAATESADDAAGAERTTRPSPLRRARRPPRSPTPRPPTASKRAAATPRQRTTTRRRHTMANFTIADIKALREQLGTGMVDTKKALEEADGDVEKAVEILRLKGAKGNAKRADRSTSEGLVTARENDGAVTLLELACETDFVAKNDRFIALADKVVTAAAAAGADSVEAALAADADGQTVEQLISDEAAIIGEKVELRRRGARLHPATTPRLLARSRSTSRFANPSYLTRDAVPEADVEKEREIVTEISRNEGKPEAALPKIVEGRVNAFFKQVALLDQDYAKDNKLSVAKVASDAGLTLTDFARFKVGA